jgi:hypothetical protein
MFGHESTYPLFHFHIISAIDFCETPTSLEGLMAHQKENLALVLWVFLGEALGIGLRYSPVFLHMGAESVGW